MRGAVFPWRENNRFELLVDGGRFFPAMLESIAGASRRIDVELYLVEAGSCSEQLLVALTEAARRGVAVRCLFDGFGTLRMDAGLRRQLEEAGAELRIFNPVRFGHGLHNLHRDHRKIFIIDGEEAFVGGSGATDDFWNPAKSDCNWHEVMVRIQGPLVEDWLALFERQWEAVGRRRAWKPRPRRGRERPPPPPAAQEGQGRVAYADARQHRDILQALIRALVGGRERIWFATPYFLPTWRVRWALRRAARRGADVRLLLTGRHTDNPPVRFAGQRYYRSLLRAGVRIYEYQPRFIHAKMVLVDNWVSVGSCNFDHWNLRFNLEANVEAVDRGLSQAVAASFVKDFAQSREITLEFWRSRPWWRRAREWLWGSLDRLVIGVLGRG